MNRLNLPYIHLLRYIDIVYKIAMLPVYFALFDAHFEKQAVAMAMSLVIFLTAMSMYISNNASIPLLGLSRKYSLASSELERNILAYIIAIAAGG